MKYILRKLVQPHVWRRISSERLTEPVHMNLAAALVALFGSFRAKVAFDLVIRQNSAFALLKTADLAKRLGLKELTVVEFGVAVGAGLLNLAEVAASVTRETGIVFRVVGFDTGKGMPPPRDYRDHPELYQAGDFKMDEAALRARLPKNVELIIGEVEKTVPEFLVRLRAEAPLAYVCLDVDFYHSSKHALEILRGSAEKYLPLTIVYLDDLEDDMHNSRCGELLAIAESNQLVAPRIIEKHSFLRSYRYMKNARWIDHIFYYHVVDHPYRTRLEVRREAIDLGNVYLR